MSIILLVIICIPLAFVIPMWFQTIVLGLPRNNLAFDPVHWVGPDGVVWITLLLTLVSFVLGYTYILKMKPGKVSDDESEEEAIEEPEDEEEEEAPEDEDTIEDDELTEEEEDEGEYEEEDE